MSDKKNSEALDRIANNLAGIPLSDNTVTLSFATKQLKRDIKELSKKKNSISSENASESNE